MAGRKYVRKKHPWAINLGEALKRWMEQNEFTNVEFAGELGLLPHQISEITLARSINKDISIYARIFARTGLTEADPRTIPPRETRSGREIDRHMTEKEWQAWLATQDSQGGAKISEKKGGDDMSTLQEAPELEFDGDTGESGEPDDLSQQQMPSEDTNPRQNDSLPYKTIGNMIDAFVAVVAAQMSQPVLQQLQDTEQSVGREIAALRKQVAVLQRTVNSQQPKAAVSTVKELTIKELAIKLGEFLEPYMSGARDPNELDPETIYALGEVAMPTRVLSGKDRDRQLRYNQALTDIQKGSE